MPTEPKAVVPSGPKKTLAQKLNKRMKRLVRVTLAPAFNLRFALDRRMRSTAVRATVASMPASSQSSLEPRRVVPLIICALAGPNEEPTLQDLLESARCYLPEGSYRFVVVDDSGELGIWRLVSTYPEVDYIRNWKLRGAWFLDNSLRRAYRWALARYTFTSLLKIDTDALIINPGLQADIDARLSANPKIGMLGSCRVTCTGAVRDFVPTAKQFERTGDYWTKIIAEALKHGYELGEHAQGGAYLITQPCLQAMEKAGYLPPRTSRDFVGEDAIFSLYTRATGYEIADFALDGPFGIAFKGLPLPKEELVAQGKKVIHSVKNKPEDWPIRQYFKARRATVHAGQKMVG